MKWPSAEFRRLSSPSRLSYYQQYEDTVSHQIRLHGMLLLHPLQSKTLSEDYGKLIRYTDCLVDTATRVMTAGRHSSRPDSLNLVHSKRYELYDYLLPRLNATDLGLRKESSVIREGGQRYMSLELLRAAERFVQRDETARDLLGAAIAELSQLPSDKFFAQLAAAIYPDAHTRLAVLRSQAIIGSCSHDSRPREHAIDIARLAASAANWEVFLRAHLEVMNDRFDRSTDGSYAWAARKTYIRELEALGIDVEMLLAGSLIDHASPSEGHYQGSVNRVGRAIGDSPRRDEYLAKLAQRIGDRSLDDHNRALAFVTYFWAMRESKAGTMAQRREVMRQLTARLPDYLAAPQLAVVEAWK